MLINAGTGGLPANTGGRVLYADADSFTRLTPQGHPESGWIPFSVVAADGETRAQVPSIARAIDPLYEIGFRVFASTGRNISGVLSAPLWRPTATCMIGR